MPAFETPTQDQSLGDHFWIRFATQGAISVVRTDGHFRSIVMPEAESLVGVEGVDFFKGGYVYPIDYITAAELQADGYTVDLDAGFGDGEYGDDEYGDNQ